MLKTLYNKVLSFSEHPRARYLLAFISFIESSIFPVPPDVMLVPMVLAKEQKAMEYFAIATLFSVIGGIFGYLLGLFFMQTIGLAIIDFLGYQSAFATVTSWFEHYGVWLVLLAGFTPIPYKLFTLGAGAMSMSFVPFVLASLVGRGLRFFIVTRLVIAFQSALENNFLQKCKQNFKHIGKIVVSLLILSILIYSFTLKLI